MIRVARAEPSSASVRLRTGLLPRDSHPHGLSAIARFDRVEHLWQTITKAPKAGWHIVELSLVLHVAFKPFASATPNRVRPGVGLP